MNLPLTGPFRGEAPHLPPGVARPTWVTVDLRGSYPARQATQPLGSLLQAGEESLELLESRLTRLAEADWLHGVLLRVGDLQVSPATAFALRGLVGRLAARKRVTAYLPRLTMTSTLAVSTATELVAPESAEVLLTGFGLERMYLGEFLRRQGIGFEHLRLYEYKAALTSLSESRMDAADREQLTRLVGCLEDAWVNDLAAGRGVSRSTARGWIGLNLTGAQAAQASGLLDKVAYEDELIGPATQPLGAVLRLLQPRRAAARAGSRRVAVVSAEGHIVTGRSHASPLPPPLGGPTAGAETVVAALRRAKADPNTAAIVLYVDSGGGSALASDLIWREVATSTKPVVGVMGGTAASGGYYVLAAAAHIVTTPYTVTGSIGVVAGRPVTEEFNRRHGLQPEQVGSRDALMFRSGQPWTEPQRDFMRRMMEETYTRFVERVARGRRLGPDRAEALARGRIWSGADAVACGLADELGDLHTALDRARELAGLPYGAPAWNAGPKPRWPGLPEFAADARDAARSGLTLPFGTEAVLLLAAQTLTVR